MYPKPKREPFALWLGGHNKPTIERTARLAESLASTPEAVPSTVVRKRPDKRLKAFPALRPTAISFATFSCGQTRVEK